MFKAVALGYRNSEIAEMSFLSVKTVETYKTHLMQKLGVTAVLSWFATCSNSTSSM